jgi:hypothetical protein
MTNYSLEWVFGLFVLFQVKHFLADFVFQNVYMLKKANPSWDFIYPLGLHCGIHALFTLAIVLFIHPALWYLAALDFVIHFITDRIKAGPKYFGRFDNSNSKAYWILFGADQLVHHLTHVYICWILVTQ